MLAFALEYDPDDVV